MKFILVMQICSFTLGTCDVAMERAMPFNSYHECSMSGHLNSIKVMQDLGDEFTNENRTVVRHWCEQKTEI